MLTAVLGDLIIDKYIEYESTRLSPEAPCPVVKYRKTKISIGGAGNVVSSINGLNIPTSLIYCKEIISDKNEVNLPNIECYYFRRHGYKQSVKTRHCVDGIQFFREDTERESSEFSFSKEVVEEIEEYLKNSKVKNLIISDYQKGTLHKLELYKLLEFCRNNSIKTFVDTKIREAKYLANSFLFKPNLKEFIKLTGYNPSEYSNQSLISGIYPYAQKLIKDLKIENIVVTLGEYGAGWYQKDKVFSINSEKVNVMDIVGAGDSFLAGIAYTYSRKDIIDYKNKLKFCSHLSKSTILKYGTNPLNNKDLQEAKQKISTHEIGFTNGCFDLLHPGHIHLLKEAKKQCKKLIVGLNSDNSVRELKGCNRPINKQEERKKILENIKWVDEVIIFDETTPLKLIKKIKPNLLIKGSDYSLDEVVGVEYMNSTGGEILLVDLLETDSTSTRIMKFNEK